MINLKKITKYQRTFSMNNYTALNEKILEELTNFTANISKGLGKASGKDQVLQVVKDYISRWKIEDNFKFKKQQYGLEKIKVRRYKRIQVMNYLLSMVMLFNNIINLKALGKTLRRQIIQIRKYVHMWLYRLADGIKKIIDINTTQIIEKLHPKRKPRRRDLFTVMHVPFRMA